ncbi:MAG: hypothetical protein HY314_10640 [Acidobacteria bacterium]|nr:hypothetical protein [Acidobacteriota bacterium]
MRPKKIALILIGSAILACGASAGSLAKPQLLRDRNNDVRLELVGRALGGSTYAVAIDHTKAYLGTGFGLLVLARLCPLLRKQWTKLSDSDAAGPEFLRGWL